MMIEAVKEEASQLLRQGYDGVLGLAKRWGQAGPYLFTKPEELQDLVLEPRYPLAKIICQLQRKWPDKKLGAIVRGCDQRALKNLEERGIFQRDGFVFIGIACSAEEAEACNCDKPLYDTHGCTGCWKCVEKCPQEAIKIINPCPILVPKEFEAGIFPRKAIYKPFPQAVPNRAVRDGEHCLKIQGRLDCKGCENICEAKAITHEMEDRYEEVEVGAIVVATGYELLPKGEIREFEEDPDILDGLQFERILCPSGPTNGVILRPSDGKVAKEVVFISCVGSRDPEHGLPYCSRVCCMYLVKMAMLYKYAVHDGQAYIFYMDIRVTGKGYEEFVQRAVEENGVLYLRGRVSKVFRDGDKIKVWGADTLTGKRVEIAADLVVLGMAITPDARARELAEKLGIATDEHGFMAEIHPKLRPLETSVPGIFLAGVVQGPKDIQDSVAQASGAASKVLVLFSKDELILEKVAAS